jgi:hypothetical protein
MTRTSSASVLPPPIKEGSNPLVVLVSLVSFVFLFQPTVEAYLGAMRMAPSRRTSSPLKYSLVIIA